MTKLTVPQALHLETIDRNESGALSYAIKKDLWKQGLVNYDSLAGWYLSAAGRRALEDGVDTDPSNG